MHHVLRNLVIFRRGDKIKDIKTGNTHFVEYVQITKGKLIILTSDGDKFKDSEVKNITWHDKKS